MIKFGTNKIGKVMFGNSVIKKIYYGNNLVYDNGATPTGYSIVPVSITPWQHNQWITIGLDINADGTFRLFKSSGQGTFNTPEMLYPQTDTYDATKVITQIPIPQSAGQHSMDISVWWSSGTTRDHNNHTITFNVVEN